MTKDRGFTVAVVLAGLAASVIFTVLVSNKGLADRLRARLKEYLVALSESFARFSESGNPKIQYKVQYNTDYGKKQADPVDPDMKEFFSL